MFGFVYWNTFPNSITCEAFLCTVNPTGTSCVTFWCKQEESYGHVLMVCKFYWQFRDDILHPLHLHFKTCGIPKQKLRFLLLIHIPLMIIFNSQTQLSFFAWKDRLKMKWLFFKSINFFLGNLFPNVVDHSSYFHKDTS